MQRVHVRATGGLTRPLRPSLRALSRPLATSTQVPHTRTTTSALASISTPPAAPQNKDYTSHFMSWVKKEPQLVVLCGLSNVASVISYLLVAPALGNVIDIISNKEPVANLLKAMGILGGIYLFTNVSLAAQVIYSTLLGERVANRLRETIFSTLMEKPLPFFDRNKVGDLMSSLGTDVTYIRELVIRLFGSRGFRSIIELAGVVVVLTALSWKMSLLLMISVPLVAPITKALTAKIQAISAKVQASAAAAASVADESIDNIRTVRIFGAEQNVLDKFAAHVEEAHKNSVVVAWLQGLLSGSNRLTTSLSIMATIGYGSWLALQGEVTAGVAYTFFVYSLTLGISLGTISSTLGEMARVASSMERIVRLLDPSFGVEAQDDPKRKRLRGEISFEGVTFRYPTRDYPALVDFKLQIPAGKFYALVGSSGSGKSTIGSLLIGLYGVNQGVVRVDGKDVREYETSTLRDQVVLVQQDTALFSGTVLDNIRYGRKTASVEEAIEAARAAQAHDFIMQLPNGYDTLLGEKGVNLSGGQRQRVALARALLMDPQILILDESTSALDTETETAVMAAVRRKMQDRTLISIAHRLSTVRAADCIVVLSQGRILEQGPHEDLVAQPNSCYASMVSLSESERASNDSDAESLDSQAVSMSAAADIHHRPRPLELPPSAAPARVPPPATATTTTQRVFKASKENADKSITYSFN